MTTRITSKTNLHEISGAAYGANKSRHVRGVTVNGARAIYVNKSLGDKITDIFKRAFGIGPSLTQQREDGARAVREVLINQFGVAMADKALTNVAKRTRRTAAELMRQGITTKELGEIGDELQKGAKARANNDRLRVRESSADAARRADARRQVSDTVNRAIMEWTGPEPPKGDTLMDQAGQAYRALDEKQQFFVHKRLQAILRHRINIDDPVDKKRIAKETLKLARSATSETFDALSDKWAEMNTAAGKLMRSARGGDVAMLVDGAIGVGNTAHGIGPLEQDARGWDDKSHDEKVLAPVSAEDIRAFSAQLLDDQLTGTAPVDAQAAYRRAMGTRGAARATLLAVQLTSLMSPQGGYGVAGDTAINFVFDGVRDSVIALAAKGNVAGVATELNAVRGAWAEAMNELCALTPEERQDVERSVADQVARKFGRNHKKFDNEYEVALSMALKNARNAKNAKLQRHIKKKGLDSGDKEVVRFMDAVLSKAGVADKDQVLKAYDALLSAAEKGVVHRRQRIDSDISEIELDDSF